MINQTAIPTCCDRSTKPVPSIWPDTMWPPNLPPAAIAHSRFTASVIEGLNEVLHTQGYDISVFQISSIEERKEFFEMLPVRRNADAVIVASFDIDNNEIAQLASVGVPIVGNN